MENYNLEKNIQVMCLTATSFPDGVMDAYKKLQSFVTDPNGRRYFGISRPNKDGIIIYKACAEEKETGEAEKLGLESFTINAGNFASTYIVDHMKDSESIGNAFKELLKNPNLDPQGYCLEMYKDFDDKDVQCMVPLK